MREPGFTPLNQSQQAAMLELFDRISDRDIDAGEELWVRDALTHLVWRTRDQLLEGDVRDRTSHIVSIRFAATGEILNTTCTCRLRGDCRHVVAVLLAADEGNEHLEDEDEDEDEDGSQTGPAQDRRPASPEFRLRLSATGGVIEWRQPGSAGFVPIKQAALRKAGYAAYDEFGHEDCILDDTARRFLLAVKAGFDEIVQYGHGSPEFKVFLNRLLRHPGFERSVVSPAGEPLVREPEPLRWVIHEPASAGQNGGPAPADADYEARLCTADGRDPGPSLATLDGWPTLFVVPGRVYEIHDPLVMAPGAETRLLLPAAAVESAAGVAGLLAMNVRLPDRLAARVQPVVMQVTVRCRLRPATRDTAECFEVSARAHGRGNTSDESWDGSTRQVAPQPPAPAAEKPDAPILTPDRSQELASGPWLEEARLTRIARDLSGTVWAGRPLTGAARRSFPDDFLNWLNRRPDGITVELDPELQKKKSALASDVLGEESFAKALTLDDFRFLLGEGGESAGD